MSPKVSIIMAAYNCAATLEDAVRSLLVQTFTDWELIICDDASTDETPVILKGLQEQNPGKIVLLSNEANSKLSFSLNRCLGVAQGEYIARMDTDDLSAPTRLARQVEHLNQNPEDAVVGTWVQRFNSEGFNDYLKPVPHPEASSLCWGTPFIHATIMMRSSIFQELRYVVSNRTVRGQDYDLWFRFFATGHRGSNLQEALYFVREDEQAIRRRTAKSRFFNWQTAMIGMKRLDAPPSWYLAPSIELLKALVPTRAALAYRRHQARRAKGTSR